ncbi:hypothetical protein RKE25_22200 (plasmid) [Dyella sp. BiH032]|uniref:hypothetical protein n=1 Tax=Dyella sp. BiH032 TaxID=3075430 RepID=UPI0028938338|nr:hypothetical protein [Dyella sp. BiH032]WNL48444.1 hypothetical protein RKE25_22200 [Dyella sp. BiH032]
MTFKHHCLAHSEVHAFKVQQLEGVPEIRYWNGALVASWFGWATLALAVLAALFAAVGIYADDDGVRGGYFWAFVMLGIAGIIAGGMHTVERFRNADIIEREERVNEMVREATIAEKEWVVSQYENHYEVQHAVRRWLKEEGKLLRNRDVCAIRAHVLRVEPARHAAHIDRALARG